MSALSIYASICRNLLQFNSLDDPNSEVWEETVRKLRKLRHVVQCRVCKAIAKDPYGASGCNHITCRDCKHLKKGFISGCRYCKNPTALEHDKQTEAVLKCYAKVCEILQSYHADEINSQRKDRIEKIKDLVCEGVHLFDQKGPKITLYEKYGGSSEKSRLPCLTGSTENQRKKSDVDHVRNENKFSQDGGSIQDGRHVEDGGSEERTNEQNLEKCSGLLDRTDEKLQPDSPTASPIKLDLGKNLGKKINGHFSSQNQTGDGAFPKRYSIKDKQSKNNGLTSNLLDDNISAEMHASNQEHPEDRRVRSKEGVNGYSCKEQLNIIDYNGILSQKHSKRKSSNEMAPPRERKRKTVKDNGVVESQNSLKCPTADELNGQEASELFCNKGNPYAKSLRQYHRNENRLFTKQDEASAQDGVQVTSKNGRQSNRHRAYSFIRKNKYKCMCGSASGLKHFTDICNHKRCVCYAAGVPCVSCKCRFCSNPHKSHYSLKWSSLGIESDMTAVKIEQASEDGL